jgi:hypothetical protein
MKLSIIIVNYRSWGFLQKALETLQPGFPPDWEIIVVDNESLAEPFRQFQQKYPWVTFVANARNSGFGFGCNLGAAQATGSYLLFMNPDVIANSKNIRSLIRVLENHPDVALISPKQVNEFGRPQKVFDDFPELLNQSKILKVLLRLFGQSPQRDLPANDATLTYCDWITGSCLLVSRADFDAIGDRWLVGRLLDVRRRRRSLPPRTGHGYARRLCLQYPGGARPRWIQQDKCRCTGDDEARGHYFQACLRAKTFLGNAAQADAHIDCLLAAAWAKHCGGTQPADITPGPGIAGARQGAEQPAEILCRRAEIRRLAQPPGD